MLEALVATRCPTLWAAWGPQTKSSLGLAGENLVARALRRAGWRVMAHRLSLPAGEIDLLAMHKRRIVLVEVKSTWMPRHLLAQGPSGWAHLWRPARRFSPEQFSTYRSCLGQVQRRLPHLKRSPLAIDLVEVFFARGWPIARLIHHRDLKAPPSEAHPGGFPRGFPAHPDAPK